MIQAAQEKERRISARIPHESRVKLKRIESALFQRGRLVNYSRTGVYLETDAAFEPGSEILLAIEESPFPDSEPGSYDIWHGIVRHCNDIDSHFRYGCGVELTYRLGSAFFISQ